MTFFNRKEDVIDIELTQFGKHLLSMGKFRPHSYAFFDDDILYDAKFAGVTTEAQNQIEDRIKETPRLRTQYAFRGIETEITQNLQDIRTNAVQEDSLDRNQPKLTTIQQTADKYYSTSAPLGNARGGVQQAPAWRVYFLKGELSGSVEIQNNARQPSQGIPQLDTEITYVSTVKTDVNVTEAGFSHGEESFEDGTYIHIEHESVLLEIEEINSFRLNGEYEIEVFKVDDELDSNGVATGKELLTPLNFQSPVQKMYEITPDNIYVPKRDDEQLAPPVNRAHVEYYLDLDVDSEIDSSVMCEVKPADKTQGVFSTRRFVCEEDTLERERTNIYSPDEEFDDPCD